MVNQRHQVSLICELVHGFRSPGAPGICPHAWVLQPAGKQDHGPGTRRQQQGQQDRCRSDVLGTT